MAKVECTCIQCGKVFQTKQYCIDRGQGLFCSVKCYGASIALPRIVCTCIQCGKTFERTQTQIDNGRGRFCSHKCSTDANVKKITRSCQQCEKPFVTTPAHIKYGNGIYCSKKCMGLSKRRTINRNCLYCGKSFESRPSDIKYGWAKYCSKGCFDKSRIKQPNFNCLCCGKSIVRSPWEEKHNLGKYCSHECFGVATSGKNNSRWRGGSITYGDNWKSQRELVRQRDGDICQLCHRKPRKGEKRFAIHHIVKARLFKGDYQSANDLSNLITLCPQCHPKAERGVVAVPRPLL